MTHYQMRLDALSQGNLQQAYYCFGQALKEDYDNADYHRGLANAASPLAFTSMQMHAQAIASAQRAALLSPHDVENWLTLTNTANAAGHYDLAICAAERATKFGINLADIYSVIGHLYAKTYRRNKAMEYYAKA